MAFVDRLRHILRMVPELGDVLACYPKLGKPETKEADQALFDLLIAFCDHYLTAMLEQRQRDANKSSSIDTLQFLQNSCLLQDNYQRNQTSAMFQALVIGTNESIARFNNRCVQMLASARVAGLDYTQGELVDQYLQAVLPVQDPDLKFQVRFWLNTCSQEKLANKTTDLTVMAMQPELQRK
jgi:hypothetical protein